MSNLMSHEDSPKNPSWGWLRLPDSALVSGKQHRTQKESLISYSIPVGPSESGLCRAMFYALGASASYAPKLHKLGPHPLLTARRPSLPGTAWGRPALTEIYTFNCFTTVCMCHSLRSDQMPMMENGCLFHVTANPSPRLLSFRP